MEDRYPNILLKVADLTNLAREYVWKINPQIEIMGANNDAIDLQDNINKLIREYIAKHGII